MITVRRVALALATLAAVAGFAGLTGVATGSATVAETSRCYVEHICVID